MTTDKVGRAPLYVRALRLRNLHVGGFGSFVLFECMIAIGVLLALAELVTWWAVLVLPVAVAAMVKINDVAMSGSRARRAAGARERTGLDGVRAEQSRAAYRSQDDAERAGSGHRSLDDAERSAPVRAAHRSLDDAEPSRVAAHRSYDDADRDGEPVVVQRHTSVLDRDDLDQAGESRHAASRHAAERARAAGRAERAGVGAGQRADSEFAVAGQRTAEQSDQAGQRTPAVAAQASTSRTIPAAGSVVGGQRSNSGAGTPQSEEARRPVGVIRISIPPRDGGTRGSAARTSTDDVQPSAPAERTQDQAAPARATVEAEAPAGRRVGDGTDAARHAGETAVGAPAQVLTNPTTGHVYGEDTGVVPGTGIWLNRPGTRRADGPYASQHGETDASVHRGQGAVYGRGGYGYDTSGDSNDSLHGGMPRNGGSYGTTYGSGVYGGAPSNPRYATGDDSYGYAADGDAGYGHAAESDARPGYAVDGDAGYGYADDGDAGRGGAAGADSYGSAGRGYQADLTDPYGRGAGSIGGGTADGHSGRGGYGQHAGQGDHVAGQGYGGGHGLDDSLWSGGGSQSRGQERRSWVGGPAGYDPDPRTESFNTGYARASSGNDDQGGDEGRHSRGRHADEDYTSGRHTDRGWRTEDDLTRSRTTTNQGRFG